MPSPKRAPQVNVACAPRRHSLVVDLDDVRELLRSVLRTGPGHHPSRSSRRDNAPETVDFSGGHRACVEARRGNYERSQALFEDALAIHRANDNRRAEAKTLEELGNPHCVQASLKYRERRDQAAKQRVLQVLGRDAQERCPTSTAPTGSCDKDQDLVAWVNLNYWPTTLRLGPDLKVVAKEDGLDRAMAHVP